MKALDGMQRNFLTRPSFLSLWCYSGPSEHSRSPRQRFLVFEASFSLLTISIVRFSLCVCRRSLPGFPEPLSEPIQIAGHPSPGAASSWPGLLCVFEHRFGLWSSSRFSFVVNELSPYHLYLQAPLRSRTFEGMAFAFRHSTPLVLRVLVPVSVPFIGWRAVFQVGCQARVYRRH